MALVVAAGVAQAQTRPVVIIDPGHGGQDSGVVDGGLVEKDLVLRLAFAVATAFVEEGWDVRLTRSGDYAVGWDDRRAFAEEAGAALLLMFHLNRDTTRTRYGAEVYAYLEHSPSAAAAAAMATALRDAGSPVEVQPRPWRFLQSPTVPTVMMELAFMTHPVERRLVQLDAFHRILGESLVRGADAFVNR